MKTRNRTSSDAGLPRRIISFAGLPFISSLAPLLVLPVIARVGGPSAWAAIGVGQAIGSMAAIVVSLGWSLTGPAEVARISESAHRSRVYALSLLNRGTVFLTCLPMLVGVSSALAPAGAAREAAWMAVASAAAGLSPSWFCIATGSASKIAVYDVLPRLLAIAAGFPIIVLTGEIVWFPVSMLIASLCGTTFFTMRHARLGDFQDVSWDDILMSIWDKKIALATTFAAGAYASTPVLIVAAWASLGSLAMFVSAEKLYRVGLLSVVALGNSLQGWVAEKGIQIERMKFSLVSHSVLGVLGLAIIVLLGPTATRLMFGELVAADVTTCLWFGLAFLFVSINTALGTHILVPFGKVRAVLSSTLAGAGLGLPAMIGLSYSLQGAGGAMGLAIGELIVCIVQSFTISRMAKEKKKAQGVVVHPNRFHNVRTTQGFESQKSKSTSF